MLEHISPESTSVTGQLMRKLDQEIDAIMGKPIDPEYHKYRASAFTEAIAIVTCASSEEIKNVAMLRYEERSSG